MTVTIVVTAGCEVATGGTGSLGCAVVGGMAGNWAGYAVSTPSDQQTLGGALNAEAWGAVQGAASWGAGKAGGALWGKLATTAGGRTVTKLASKAVTKAKGALGKLTGKAATGGEDAVEDAAGATGSSGGKSAAKGGAPHEEPSAPVKSGGGCNSFVPGTKVLLAGGKTKNIEDVKVGDKVVSTDPKTGKTRLEPVLAAFGGIAYNNLVQITVDTDGKRGHHTGIITATEHHKFWDKARHRWIRADQLAPGTVLRAPHGAPVIVTHAVFVPGHPVVRDLTVAEVHTYYVEAGSTPVLVHNCGDGGKWGQLWPAGAGNEINHMPQNASTPLTKYSGPATRMAKADHRQIYSTGSSIQSQAWLQMQRELVDSGQIDRAMMNDINDVATRFPGEYNNAIGEMIGSLPSNDAYQALGLYWVKLMYN
ncbi:MAG: Hint domain-containing protein [Mycobacterium sp.]